MSILQLTYDLMAIILGYLIDPWDCNSLSLSCKSLRIITTKILDNREQRYGRVINARFYCTSLLSDDTKHGIYCEYIPIADEVRSGYYVRGMKHGYFITQIPNQKIVERYYHGDRLSSRTFDLTNGGVSLKSYENPLIFYRRCGEHTIQKILSGDDSYIFLQNREDFYYNSGTVKHIRGTSGRYKISARSYGSLENNLYKIHYYLDGKIAITRYCKAIISFPDDCVVLEPTSLYIHKSEKVLINKYLGIKIIRYSGDLLRFMAYRIKERDKSKTALKLSWSRNGKLVDLEYNRDKYTLLELFMMQKPEVQILLFGMLKYM